MRLVAARSARRGLPGVASAGFPTPSSGFGSGSLGLRRYPQPHLHCWARPRSASNLNRCWCSSRPTASVGVHLRYASLDRQPRISRQVVRRTLKGTTIKSRATPITELRNYGSPQFLNYTIAQLHNPWNQYRCRKFWCIYVAMIEKWQFIYYFTIFYISPFTIKSQRPL